MPRLCRHPACFGWFHITSCIRPPKKGEHYYWAERMVIDHAESDFPKTLAFPIAVPLNRPTPENPET